MSHRITGISSMATRQILADLAAAYQAQNGCEVAIKSMGGVDAARLVRAGEPVDVVLLASPAMAELEAEGHVRAGSRIDFARSAMAMAVPAGAVRPRIRNAAELKQAILGAGRVAYSTGPSGRQLEQMLERWGIAAEVAARLIQAPAGVPVGALLARGEADLGFQQLSELLGAAGIDVVGPLPPDVAADTIFAAGIARASAQPDAAQALLDFLASPATEPTKRRHGMQAP